MKLYRLLLGGVAVGILALGFQNPVAAQSAPSNEELSKRIDALDIKLDAIIQMMSKEKVTPANNTDASGPAKSEPPQAAAGSPAGLQQGLALDLYLFSQNQDIKKISTVKDVVPSASEIVPSPPSFDWGSFTQLDSMKRFSGPMEKRVGLNWTGLINVPVSGQQVFDLEIAVGPSSNSEACSAFLVIDDHSIIDMESGKMTGGYGDYEPRSNDKQGGVALDGGYHKFSLWGYCNGRSPDFSKVHFNLLSKGPRDRAPKPIAADRFVTEG